MIYKKLLLNANGGIISTQQQSEAAENTATLFIGLGGTGVEAIRHVKSQVYRRLRPDNVDASIPEYKHIRFLGVDTANTRGDKSISENNKDSQLLVLSEDEFFNIKNTNFGELLSNKRALDQKPEFNWARSKEALPRVDLTQPGAGGVRQLGRMLLVDKSKDFINKIQTELENARKGLDDDPKINIHIFTGLSGGTGSGIFLDACYLIKQAAGPKASILGYFFLPDVNLTKIPYEASVTREYIEVNGYAALQELDYCMNLPHNGGTFTQIYKGGNIVEWNDRPVELAHLISATDANKNVKSDAYNNAMRVTSEYVMEMITKQLPLKEGTVFDMNEHISNFAKAVNKRSSSKKIGRSFDYVVIGASCAIVPMREINTYLASGMFSKFSPELKVRKPKEKEISEIISAAFTGREGVSETNIVDYLYHKLEEEEVPFEPYNESWKYVKEHGNKELDDHYSDIYNKNVGAITTCKKHLSSGHARIGSLEPNKTSLLSEIVKKLDEYVDKLKYGPVFVSNAISGAEGKNLLNVIEGLIAEASSKLTHALSQFPQRQKEHREAKEDFDHAKDSLKAVLLQPTRKYESYLLYVESEKKAELEIKRYEELIEILQELKTQLRQLNQRYYQKLSQVLVNTIDTFHQNLLDLNARKVVEQEATYEMQLMTIEELRETMDALIAKKEPATVFGNFIGELTKDEASTAWLSDDEAKICKIINDYFVKDLFKENSQKTIELFLQEKYDTDNASELQEHIYKDFITKLEKKAVPLFPYDNGIWSSSDSNEVKYLSIPETSHSIQSAADKLKTNNSSWQIKTTGLTDRIYIMRNACVVPLAAYAEIKQYELNYFKSIEAGLHYYEGFDYKNEPIKNMKFSDWRKLGPLTPASLIDLENGAIPTREKQLIENAESLFDKAKHFNLFDEEYHILELVNYEESKAKLEKLLTQLKKSSPNIKELKAIENDLEESKISLKPSKLTLQSTGDPDALDSLLIDYFVSSPALHEPLHETVNQLEELDALKDEIIQLIKERRYEIEVIEQGIKDFARAFAVGVFTIDKFKITYIEETEYGIPEEHLLSEMGQPFGDISPYQAFLNYLELDSDMQNKILEQANTKLKEMDEAIVASKKMKEYLTKDKFATWAKLIKGREDEEEILSFLKQLYVEFENNCDLLA